MSSESTPKTVTVTITMDLDEFVEQYQAHYIGRDEGERFLEDARRDGTLNDLFHSFVMVQLRNAAPESRRAIIYALMAQASARSRIESALRHLAPQLGDPTDVSEMVCEAAQVANAVSGNATDWLAAQFGIDRDEFIGDVPLDVPFHAFRELDAESEGEDVCRAVEGDDEGRDAA